MEDVQYTLTCELPDDEEVLITRGKNVYADTIYSDGESYWTDSGVDLIEYTAWMPLPEPYRAESEVEDNVIFPFVEWGQGQHSKRYSRSYTRLTPVYDCF